MWNCVLFRLIWSRKSVPGSEPHEHRTWFDIQRFSQILSIHFQITISQAWTFSKIPKPRINSLVCYSSRKGPRSIATQEVEQYSCSKLVTSGNHYKLESIFKGPYLRPEKKFFQNSKFQNLLWHVANQILINCFLNH